MKTNYSKTKKVHHKTKGVFPLKLKRIRTQPRQRIRQILRSFIPFVNFKGINEVEDKAPPNH